MKKWVSVFTLLVVFYSGTAVAQTFSRQNQPMVNNNKNNIIMDLENRNFGRFVGESQNHKIKVNNIKREFIEYTASDANGNKDYKNKDLLVVFHGGKGNAERMKSQTIFADLAKSNNLVLLFPEGLKHVWNDGRKGYDSNVDVEFVKEMIKKYKSLGVNKVMVTGFSNGGIFSLRLACENIAEIEYFGAVAGSLPEGINCVASVGKNIMMINGTDDQFVLWEGGAIEHNENAAGGGRLMGVEDSIGVFQKANGCSIEKTRVIDINFNDRSSVDKENYRCKKGSLVFYKVEGGGHTMPGGRNRATLSNMIGNTNRDISAEKELIDFLKKKDY